MRCLPRIFLAFCVLISLPVVAQTALEGSVKDTSGKPVSGVRITLRHPGDVQAVLTTSTDQNGEFYLPSVEAGAYELRTEAKGYYLAQYDFVLRPRQPVTLAIKIQPEQNVQTIVEVTTTHQTVDPEKTSSSQTLTRSDLEMLP